MYDVFPDRLIDSPYTICNMRTREIILVVVPCHPKIDICHVFWRVEVGKYHGNLRGGAGKSSFHTKQGKRSKGDNSISYVT